MKSLIRSLNERGLDRFRSWLESGGTGDAPFNLLHDPQTSEPVMGTGEVEQTHFANRYDLAQHIADALSGCDFQYLSYEPGIWGWLSLFYIDLLCPKDLTAARKLLAHHRYLFETDSRRASTHLIREAVIAVRGHGAHAKVLLISPRGGIKDTKVLTQLASRQDLISNPSVVELAWRLYFNQRRQGLHTGAVQRFALVLQQVGLNFDLPAMSARQIADLLPEEFNHWKQRAKFDGGSKARSPREADGARAAKAQVRFDDIAVGSTWEREALATKWGYRTFHALARGVFTPAGDKKIILFVTESQQAVLPQFADKLSDQVLNWQGEASHANDLRIAQAAKSGDEIHVFYRERHHLPFRYLGRARVKDAELRTEKPSEFIFEFSSS